MKDELGNAVELAEEAAEILAHLEPNHELIRFFGEKMSGNHKLHEEFLNRFWDWQKGSWQNEPGERVNTFCIVRAFLTLREEIGKIILPRIGQVTFLNQGNSIGSDVWISLWEHGVGALHNNQEYGRQYNDDLAMIFDLDIDPRLIIICRTQDSSMPPVIADGLNRMALSWGSKWSSVPIEHAKNRITLRELLGSEIVGAKTGVYPFGIPYQDRETGNALHAGLRAMEQVMEIHLRKKLMAAILLPNVLEQLKRANVE